MDAAETEHLEKLLRAFDEVLEYHDRAGNGDTEVAKELRAKRRSLVERLNGRAQAATDDPPGRELAPVSAGSIAEVGEGA